MTQFTEYKILSANSINELSNVVNEHIKEGWQPFGALSISTATIFGDKKVTLILQPIVK